MNGRYLIAMLCGLMLLAGAVVAQTAVEPPATGALPCCAVTPGDAAGAGAAKGMDGGSMGLLFFVFALAIFLGAELIAKVPSQLHTPLMSGSNAISGISIVGALLALAVKNTNQSAMIVLGTAAVALAMINVVGGYLVTDRMLGMFQQKKKKGDK